MPIYEMSQYDYIKIQAWLEAPISELFTVLAYRNDLDTYNRLKDKGIKKH